MYYRFAPLQVHHRSSVDVPPNTVALVLTNVPVIFTHPFLLVFSVLLLQFTKCISTDAV